MTKQTLAYMSGYNDGYDGVIRENPYDPETQPSLHRQYAAGRKEGERDYRNCSYDQD